MRNLNVHLFSTNRKLAEYLSLVCEFLKLEKDCVEVRGDMAILEQAGGDMVFTKNKDIAFELSDECSCMVLHYLPDISIVFKLQDANINFMFLPGLKTAKKKVSK